MFVEYFVELQRDIVIIKRLHKLISVTPLSSNNTNILNEVSHEELCESFVFWFSQTKLVFGESLIISPEQSLRDEGIDVILYFPDSNMKIGIQVKSYGDVENPDFSTNVIKQIFRSKKHGITKLILALAGDLTSRSQQEKIRGLVSELSQRNDNYVHTLVPESVLNIFLTYRRKIQPLKVVMLDHKDAMLLAEGITESLTTKDRDVKVTITIENKGEIENRDDMFNLMLMLNRANLDVIDSLQNIHYTNEIITLDGNETKFNIENPSIERTLTV
ncbi:MAG: hypothetical protein ACRD8W_31815, partial [Nitrososphaeraceae archaeon]